MSQTISPTETGEFCPETNITFTVTLPLIKANTTPSVASWTNTPIIVSGVANLTSNTNNQTTTFTFVGKFRDVNLMQVFRVSYIANSNPTVTIDKDFQFKNIKSFFLFGSATINILSCNSTQPDNCFSSNLSSCKYPN